MTNYVLVDLDSAIKLGIKEAMILQAVTEGCNSLQSITERCKIFSYQLVSRYTKSLVDKGVLVVRRIGESNLDQRKLYYTNKEM